MSKHHTMGKALLLSCALLLLILPPGAVRAGEDSAPQRWQGAIRLTITLEGSSVLLGCPFQAGRTVETWLLNVDWLEKRRIDVKNRRGDLVGQFVILQDAGSSWKAEKKGRYAIACPRGTATDERVFSGSAKGSGKVLSSGWIYYSLSDDDPLKGILPNGAYRLQGDAMLTQTLPVQETETGCPNSQGVRKVYVRHRKSRLQYIIGGDPYFKPRGAGPLRAEGLAASLKRIRAAAARMPPAARRFDRQGRALQDGRMKGAYATESTRGWVEAASWDISRVRDVQAVLDPAPENWRPSRQAGQDVIEIAARLEGGEAGKAKFRFRLSEVSREKGYALNAGDGDELDLEFPSGQEGFGQPKKTADGWEIETDEAVNQAAVRIQSLDYGAWGRLSAEVNVDGQWLPCRSRDGKTSVTVPRDDNQNYIADSWEREKGVEGQPAASDKDDLPEGVGDPGEPGDGFSNYEEYRGFLVHGVWTDTDPRRKDLFIFDQLGFGVGYFTNLGLTLHLIAENEFDDQRVVNFNRDQDKTLPEQADSGQKGLHLTGADLDAAYGRTSDVGCPNVVDAVKIDAMSIWDDKLLSAGGDDPASVEQGFQQDLDAVIAHELGHGVNMMHHGVDVQPPGNTAAAAGDIGLDQMWEPGVTATTGGKWSGDLNCVMSYRPLPMKYYGRDGRYHPYPTDKAPSVPTGFCDSPVGTGVNAPGYTPGPGDSRPYPVAGDAAWGACRKMMDLKGKHYYGDLLGD